MVRVLISSIIWLVRLPFLLLDVMWDFLGKFLLSPWGLIVPITGLVLLFLAMQLERLPSNLAGNYAQRFNDCPDAEVPRTIESLVQLGDSGLAALVAGLRSPRESVYLGCRDALLKHLDRWANEKDVERNKHYRILTETLYEQFPEFGPLGRVATVQLTERVLRDSARRGGVDAAKVASRCEKLLAEIRHTRRQIQIPAESSTAPTGDAIVRMNRNTISSDLVAVEETPSEHVAEKIDQKFTPQKSNEKVDQMLVDEFSTPRSELLHAYQQSPLYRRQMETPYRRPGIGPVPGKTDLETYESSQDVWASMSLPNQRNMGSDSLIADRGGTKIAGRFEADPGSMNISDEYIGARTNYQGTDRNEFLSEELQQISLERIPSLPTTKLMRLLQHPDDRYVSAARKTLVGRDGFREPHLQLAFRLYHPTTSVRSEVVGLLPGIKGVQTSVWLTELMNDPNGDVRYQAATAIATSGDPAMLKFLAEKGKRDTDQRVVDLAGRVLEKRGRP